MYINVSIVQHMHAKPMFPSLNSSQKKKMDFCGHICQGRLATYLDWQVEEIYFSSHFMCMCVCVCVFEICVEKNPFIQQLSWKNIVCGWVPIQRLQNLSVLG